MIDVPEHDQLELVQLQQQTRNTALVFTAHSKLHGFPLSLSPPSITCMLSRHYNTTRSIAPIVPSRQTKATSGTDDGNHQAAIPRHLPGWQPLFDVAVTGTALETQTYSHGIPGLLILQSS